MADLGFKSQQQVTNNKKTTPVTITINLAVELE